MITTRPSPSSRRRASTSRRWAPRGRSGARSTSPPGPPGRSGEPARAEKLLRESIRVLAPLEDRATLCESQRSLAQLLVEQGKLDEAERLALEARHTVGPQDLTSLATTAMALGIVRAAQGRDEEAEELLREAHKTVIETDHKRSQLETLFQLHKFLRERGRLDEAQELGMSEALAEVGFTPTS